MAYFPPYQSIANAPATPTLPPNWGSVGNSPMFQGYEGGAPIPSYLQPTPSAIPTAPVYGPANYGALSNPAVVEGAESGLNGLASQVAPYEFGAAAPRASLRSILSGAIKTPEFGVAGGATLLGSLLRDNTREGTAPHVAGTALATGGATATLPALASGVGLLGGSTLGLPITVGALAGGASGSLINHALGSGAGTDFGPFHWHNQQPAGHATDLGHSPDLEHVINVATDLHAQGDISSDDYKTIIKQAQLNVKLGADPKQVAADVGGMVSTAAQLQIQRQSEAAANKTSAHDQLLQQVAIAKLMQPEINQINEGSRALAESIASSRGNLSPQFQPFADMLSRSTVAGGHRQAAALQASTLALPQIQSLIASINQQNALQQAANYQAAKAASSSSSGSLQDLLNPQQAVQVAGAGGASGL